MVCVADATNLRLKLRLVLEVRDLGLPMIVALNMSDLAHSRGFRLDRERLAQELGVPVVETVAVRDGGERALLERLESLPHARTAPARPSGTTPTFEQIQPTQREVRRILHAAGYREPRAAARCSALDDARDASARRARDPRGAAVLRVPGRVQLGRGADGLIDAGVGWLGAQLHARAAGRRC